MSDAVLERVFLSLLEAAEFLRIQKSTLYAWVHQKRIPYRKHGSRVVFCKSDLLDWSQKQGIEPVTYRYKAIRFLGAGFDDIPPSRYRSLKTSCTVESRANSNPTTGKEKK